MRPDPNWRSRLARGDKVVYDCGDGQGGKAFIVDAADGERAWIYPDGGSADDDIDVDVKDLE